MTHHQTLFQRRGGPALPQPAGSRSLHLALQSQNARLEERVRQRTQELERTLTELKTAQERQVQVERLRALGEMSNGIASIFNNQLTVLIGYTDLLRLNNAQMLSNRPMAVHYLKTINTAARDSAGIVGRLREFHRSRAAEEIFLPVNLPKLLQERLRSPSRNGKTRRAPTAARFRSASTWNRLARGR